MDYTDIFTGRAGGYATASLRWPEIRSQEFASYFACLGLRAGDRFLDVPCGHGQAFQLVPSDVEYVGLDPAEDFVLACASACAPVVQSNLRHLPFHAQTFHVVGSLTGVHHEIDRREIYSEWFRILRPGGRLVLMDVWVDSRTGVFLNGFVNDWNSQGHQGDFLMKADLDVLRQVGFDQILLSQMDYCWHAPSDAAMHDFMLDLFGLDLQPGLALMRRAWLELGWTPMDAACHIPWTLAAVTATK